MAKTNCYVIGPFASKILPKPQMMFICIAYNIAGQNNRRFKLDENRLSDNNSFRGRKPVGSVANPKNFSWHKLYKLNTIGYLKIELRSTYNIQFVVVIFFF